MAAIAPPPSNATGPSSSWSVLCSSVEYAQGHEGRLLDDGIARAAERWRGPSEYVTILLTGRDDSSRTARMLPASVLLSVTSVALTAVGYAAELGGIFFPLAGVAALAAYTFFTRWVAKQSERSPFLALAERVRRAVAYEGDSASKCG